MSFDTRVKNPVIDKSNLINKERYIMSKILVAYFSATGTTGVAVVSKWKIKHHVLPFQRRLITLANMTQFLSAFQFGGTLHRRLLIHSLSNMTLVAKR